MKDYYTLLGVKQDATKKEIKKNYRILAVKFHPDKSKAPDSAAKFIAINEAYDILSDRKSRAQYDLKRWHALKELQRSSDTFTTMRPPTVSTEAKRITAQLKRSLRYHKSDSKPLKILYLIMESFYIMSRYILHVLGITLMTFVLKSILSEIPTTLQANFIGGAALGLLAAILLYGIFKVLYIAFRDSKKDSNIFAEAYRITSSEAAWLLLSVCTVCMIVYVVVLSLY